MTPTFFCLLNLKMLFKLKQTDRQLFFFCPPKLFSSFSNSQYVMYLTLLFYNCLLHKKNYKQATLLGDQICKEIVFFEKRDGLPFVLIVYKNILSDCSLYRKFRLGCNSENKFATSDDEDSSKSTLNYFIQIIGMRFFKVFISRFGVIFCTTNEFSFPRNKQIEGLIFDEVRKWGQNNVSFNEKEQDRL